MTPSHSEVARMTAALVDLFCRSFHVPPAAITYASLSAIQRTRDGHTDAFRCCFGLSVSDMRVAPLPGSNHVTDAMTATPGMGPQPLASVLTERRFSSRKLLGRSTGAHLSQRTCRTVS